MAEVEDFLEHHGVLGMKWGVRRNRQTSSKSGSGRKRSISELSNQELQDRINRIQLEARYKHLTDNPSRAKRAARWTAKFLGEVGRDVAKNYVSAYSKGAFNKLIIKKAPNVAKTMGLIK